MSKAEFDDKVRSRNRFDFLMKRWELKTIETRFPMVYVPATLVIKAVMAILAGLLYRGLKEKSGGMAV